MAFFFSCCPVLCKCSWKKYPDKKNTIDFRNGAHKGSSFFQKIWAVEEKMRIHFKIRATIKEAVDGI